MNDAPCGPSHPGILPAGTPQGLLDPGSVKVGGRAAQAAAPMSAPEDRTRKARDHADKRKRGPFCVRLPSLEISPQEAVPAFPPRPAGRRAAAAPSRPRTSGRQGRWRVYRGGLGKAPHSWGAGAPALPSPPAGPISRSIIDRPLFPEGRIRRVRPRAPANSL